MSYWIDEHLGCLSGLVVVALLGLMVWAIVQSEKQEDAACARALNIARSSSDSIAVIMKCEIKETKTVMYPVYIPVR